MVTGAWAEQKVIGEIMVFLQSHGIGTLKSQLNDAFFDVLPKDELNAWK